MATRKIKDAQDTTTNELIYFKGHAKATYMSDGSTVEDAINRIGTGGGGSSDSGKKEIVYSTGQIYQMRPNVIYWVDGMQYLDIFSFEPAEAETDSYDVFTVVGTLAIQQAFGQDLSISLPDYIKWANGQSPAIPEGTEFLNFELSISRTSDGYSEDGIEYYYAVLTLFE